jgi:hypothetical protein
MVNAPGSVLGTAAVWTWRAARRRQFNRSPPSRHDFLCMLPNQPSAYVPWRKMESSRIASIGSVSGNRCTRREAASYARGYSDDATQAPAADGAGRELPAACAGGGRRNRQAVSAGGAAGLGITAAVARLRSATCRAPRQCPPPLAAIGLSRMAVIARPVRLRTRLTAQAYITAETAIVK